MMNVAGLHALGQGIDGLLGGSAGRDHQPGDARLAQFADEVIERGGADCAFAGDLLYVVSAQIGDHAVRGRRASGGASCWRPSCPDRPFPDA